MTPRVGLGYDVHPFGTDRPLVLGGVTIEGPGLAGHSDGDAVTHAVADALLGAAGLPDLGTLFPADDERYRGVRSTHLLGEVATRVREAGWELGNVDVVVAAEVPRLGPHVDAMAATLTDVLGPVRAAGATGPAVVVRPKFGEGIGAVGRREGIAVWAIALLVPA